MKYIINDTGKNADRLKQFDIQVLDLNDMAVALQDWKGWSELNKRTTKILFPGEGAKQARESFGPHWFSDWQTQTIKASRFWWPRSAGCSPSAVVESPNHLDYRTENVIIVDDVISSEATIQKIRQRHGVWLPRARFHAIAWIAQHSAGFRGFASHHVAVTVGTAGVKVPINSLSTLLENPELAADYARRNFPNREAFLVALYDLTHSEAFLTALHALR